MVGSAIAAEAARRGHEVVGINRSGSAKEPVLGVTYEAGNIENTAEVTAHAEASDAVVIAIPGDRENGNFAPVVAAHRALIAAHPRDRFFVVGGAGGLEVNGSRLVDSPDFPEAFKAEGSAFAEVLAAYRGADSSLDWTMLAPSPMIEPGEPTDGYVLGDDAPAGESVTAGTFAVSAVDELENPSHRGVRFTVADQRK